MHASWPLSFAYLHGAANIIPGLEQALEGKTEGESLSVAIEPSNGYGERNDSMSQVVSKDMFEGDTGENIDRLVIIDPNRFWNSSKFLVVVTN